MKQFKIIAAMFLFSGILASCSQNDKTAQQPVAGGEDTFTYLVEKFADLKVMRYQVPGFDSLSLQQKTLVYFLSQAALWGDEITWDQNYKYNLLIKRTLENIVSTYSGDRSTEDWKNFMVYVKRVWFSKGIHHHYSTDKFIPAISPEYFNELLDNSESDGFPKFNGLGIAEFKNILVEIIFNPDVAAKRVNLDPDADKVKQSANNFYEYLAEPEVELYNKGHIDELDSQPVSFGLNSKLTKESGVIEERVYHLGGMYGPAIEKIIFWLEKAATVAETETQKESILMLIDYYKTGDLKTFDKFNILWLKDLTPQVDFVNGFTETYGDPLDMKGSWEALVNFKDNEATKRTEIISANAQWFEDNSPVDPEFKKEEVNGVSAKVITVAILAGDCYPTTPIGINLPNANWIRKEYGSKSVTIDNITYSYDKAGQGNGFIEEFAWSPEEVELSKKYGYLVGNITTDLHECLGHGSGQLAPGVKDDALKNYGSALEEARADLFALYYIMDEKMVELGLIPSLEAAKAEYNGYIRNGLMTQLKRIEPGKNIEESHMRNRQLIAGWVYEKGQADSVIVKKVRDGKTYFVINDYQQLRVLFGRLLKEVQRIKSTGDFEAGKELVEQYGVKVDPVLHNEVLERFNKLDIAPYGGFINPKYVPVVDGDKITNIKIEYPANFKEQMLYYSREYSSLPVIN